VPQIQATTDRDFGHLEISLGTGYCRSPEHERVLYPRVVQVEGAGTVQVRRPQGFVDGNGLGTDTGFSRRGADRCAFEGQMGTDAEGAQVQCAVHRAPGDLEFLGDAGAVGAQTREEALIEFQGLELSALQPRCRVEVALSQTHGRCTAASDRSSSPRIRTPRSRSRARWPGCGGGVESSSLRMASPRTSGTASHQSPRRYASHMRRSPASHPAGGSSSSAT
jgi:hypothetical protein